MNLEWKKLFVELVKSGAQLKAYQKKLGLNKESLKLHLGKLAEYETELSSKAVCPKKIAEALGAKIVSKPTPSWSSKSKVEEKKQEATESEKEKKDEGNEEGETS